MDSPPSALALRCVIVGCTDDVAADTLDPMQRGLCVPCRARARTLLRAQPGLTRRELLDGLNPVEPEAG